MSELRDAALLRCGGLCEHCGAPLDAAWELHHRLPGGMGGSTRERDVLSNVLALISTHHNLTPGSVHMQAQTSRALGFLISKFDLRPFDQVEVALYGGGPAHRWRWVTLTESGTYEPWSP